MREWLMRVHDWFRRDALDRQIATDTAALAAMPASHEYANPAAGTLSMFSSGAISSSAFEHIWIFLLTVFPTCGGILLSLAKVLWGSRRGG